MLHSVRNTSREAYEHVLITGKDTTQRGRIYAYISSNLGCTRRCILHLGCCLATVRAAKQSTERPGEVDVSLGARIKKLRLQNNESLQQLADAVKVSKAHIWELETGGSKNPSLELLKSLAAHFNKSVATLVGEDVSELDEADMVMFRELKALNLKPEDVKLIADLMEMIKARKGAQDHGEKD